ncbi:MAG: universal stress protein [Bacillaceae bacterium]|nr:universal stress protein [Bacillaceae bacterium]
MEKNYKTILVAVDGSKEARKALEKAIDIAKKDKSHIIIGHVVDTRTFATVEQYDQSIITRAEQYASELLEDYKTIVLDAGIESVKCILDFGSPKVKIPKEIAKKQNVDLIITGATGLNTVERILIGSVSEYIARSAKCDVLIVRN